MSNRVSLVRGLMVTALVLLAAGSPARGQVVGWKSFTSVGTIRSIAVAEDAVWAGSSGGALGLENGQTELSRLTNTDGLSQNDVLAVVVDESGRVWFALQNGILNRYDPASSRVDVVGDYKDEQISDIVAFGDSLYVGLGIGVSLYDVAKQEVKETYQNLGFSSGGNIEQTAVNSVLINGTDIWVATDKGIAKSSLTFSNLQAPSSWTQYRFRDGLPSERIREIAVIGDTAYAATSAGVAMLANDRWTSAGLAGTVLALKAASANDFFPNSTLVALLANGVFWRNPSGTWEQLGPNVANVTAMATSAAGQVWIGEKDKGLASFDFLSGEWRLTSANAPASNDFKSLLLDASGRLWCASRTAGLHVFDGQLWTNLTRADGLPSTDYRDLVLDAEGRIWAGSWGGGVTIIEDGGDGFSFTKIDTVGGVLSGFGGDPGFVLIPALAMDSADNIWLANREAINTKVLVSRTPSGQYVYFNLRDIVSKSLTSIAVDNSDRIWLGTEDAGVQVIDYKGSLLDRSDDNYSQGLTQADDRLFSNSITALAADQNGAMWIGTSTGLNIWFDQIVDDEFDTPINTIGIDAINNKWVGTANGVTILRGHRDKIGDITVGNSDIVSGNVQSFAFNAGTGEVWIGTDNGLSRAQTLFTAPREDLSQLTGFPNPFIPGGGKVFTITNLSENTNVTIFSSSGRRIKTFVAFNDIQGAQALWDGTDEDGNFVASGIYVYLASTNNTNISTSGKVAVVNR